MLQGRTLRRTGAVENNVPVRTAETNAENAAAGTMRTVPSTLLESLTGTTPREATRLAATLTQSPPLLLYEDVNQRGESVMPRVPFPSPTPTMDDPATRAPEGLPGPSRVEVVLQDIGRRVQDHLVDLHGPPLLLEGGWQTSITGVPSGRFSLDASSGEGIRDRISSRKWTGLWPSSASRA
ncbi:hypothetical protein SMICM17S_04735 [Streptomyces microflavus]